MVCLPQCAVGDLGWYVSVLHSPTDSSLGVYTQRRGGYGYAI